MKYKMEELVPLVTELTEKYTGFESTSVTYEKAEQLMGAVLYCIRETECGQEEALASEEKIPARRAYKLGYELVKQKVELALQLYHEIMKDFSCYAVCCLQDVVAEGMPEFFQWYDIRFAPQDEILTLDYPVLKDLSGTQGIDKIYEYLKCIHMEQQFLHAFPDAHIREVLGRYDTLYEDMVENICEVVLGSVLRHIAAGKPLSEPLCGNADLRQIKEAVRSDRFPEVQKRFSEAVAAIVREYCEREEEVLLYLSGAMEGAVVRLKDAAEKNTIFL